MLQQDYFLRLIEEFQAAVARFIKIKDQDKKDQEIRDLYRQYVGNYDDIRNLSFDELLDFAKDQWSEDQRIERITFVAELLYLEASYKSNPLRSMLLDKAYRLYSYIDRQSNVLSLDRQEKMALIQKEMPHIEDGLFNQ